MRILFVISLAMTLFGAPLASAQTGSLYGVIHDQEFRWMVSLSLQRMQTGFEAGGAVAVRDYDGDQV